MSARSLLAAHLVIGSLGAAVLGVLLAMIAPAVAESGPGSSAWVIRDLGVLPGDSASVADGVNERGQVAGRSSSGSATTYATFVWQRGRFVHIGARVSSPVRINERGQVAGTMAAGRHAFLWENGKLTDLGILGVGEQAESEASAINNRGAVVGTSSTHGLGYHPFLWRYGRMVDLGTLGQINAIGLRLKKRFYGGPGGAAAINDRGQIIGAVSWGKNLVYLRAFLWQDGRMHELPVPSGTWTSFATGINDRGETIGPVMGPRNGSPAIAVVWHDGLITKLGVQDTDEVAINERGQVLLNQYGTRVSTSVSCCGRTAMCTTSRPVEPHARWQQE